MRTKKRIVKRLMSELKAAQGLLLDPSENTSFRFKEVKELRSRIDLLYNKHSIEETENNEYLGLVPGSQATLRVTIKGNYDSADYFIDVLNYQVKKVINKAVKHNYSLKVNNEGQWTSLNFAVKTEDKKRFIHIFDMVHRNLQKGQWYFNGREYEDEIKQEMKLKVFLENVQ